MRIILKILSVLCLVMLLADPVLGAIELEGYSMQNGVNEVQNEGSLNSPLMKILLISAGLVFFLGLMAFLKCGGASFGGIIVGRPHSTADGFYGMCSVLCMGLALGAGTGLYLSWM